METQAFSLAASRFQPVAIGMFGLWHWFSETQRRSEQNDGNVGLLDAGVQAVPRWSFSPGWTGLVRRFPKCGSFMYGWSRLYGLRLSLVRDGLPAIHRFQRSA
jgi:hypothetical protein